MASKYAFTQALKELRFHLSSSGQGSEAARYTRVEPLCLEAYYKSIRG